MPIKSTPNTLFCEARADEAVINIFTQSKKGHFTCTEAKLFDALDDCLHDVQKYFQVHLTTHPYIAVYITGREDHIKKNEKDLRKKIIETLTSLHDIGNVRNRYKN